VLASIPAAIDTGAASRLRACGVPVLESTRTGLLALRHLLDRAALPPPGLARQPHGRADGAAIATPVAHPCRPLAARRERWSAALAAGPLPGAGLFDLLRDYGIPAVPARAAATLDEALAAAAEIGYPVALKTDTRDIAHKSDVGGVRLGIADPAGLTAAYADLSARLGPGVTVTEMAGAGPELILGMARDPALGPLVVIGAGGILAEFLADRAVALPPLTEQSAAALIARLRSARLLSGFRGQPATDLAALAAAVAAFSTLVTDLADQLAAFDINPLICTPDGPVAVDALAVPARN
jgi:acyl-CoA synthetase (NDP forming)